ncbi:HAD-IIB family hydrolase [Clostridium sp. DMHC 10]|uniref:HAD-IIB family hydrolase n=1 Tax=Clostridium sp. DMHC 10 TaxID=747377 RepID=UPI000A88017F
MENFKMICLDIDGTLLNSKHQITEETKKAIKAAVNEKGIPVILVSARMPKGIIFLQKELEIEAPIICYSGALVLDKNGETLFQKHMSVLDIKEVYTVAKKLGVHVSLYKDDEWCIEKMDEWVRQEYEITSIIPNVINFEFLFEVWEKEDSGSNKIFVYG